MAEHLDTLDGAAAAMGGRLSSGDPASPWHGAAIDSRKVEAGQLFFALPGEKTDGHAFAAQAAARGAVLVVSRAVDAPGAAAIEVPDVYQALHALTRAVRAVRPRHLVGITGSAGKTTTKELIAALLGRRWRVAKSPGNFNNTLGFPLGLLGMPRDTEWMVAEMGMSVPGELGQVSHLGKPDIAVFTNVRPVHLVNFGTLDAIAEAKSELLWGVPDGGTMVANAADPRVWNIARKFRDERGGRIRTFAFAEKDPEGNELTVRGLEVEALPGVGYRFSALYQGEKLAFESPLHGAYNVDNCLAALACVLPLGVTPAEVAEALAGMKPAAHRGVVLALAGGGLLVDDCYNSNPDAAIKALESARGLQGRRYVAVLGDMLELGPTENAQHATVGERAAALGFDLVVAVGERSRHLADAATRGGIAAEWLADAAAAAAWAAANPAGQGDVVLVKASRGTALESVVAAYRGENG